MRKVIFKIRRITLILLLIILARPSNRKPRLEFQKF